MKLSVLGATGQTGQFLVRQALEQGHVVKAVVRTPSKLTIQHDNLKVVEANIFSADSLVEHLTEQDVIMSCLGFPISIFSRVTGYTESIKAIVAAMRAAKVTQIIAMTSWYTKRCKRSELTSTSRESHSASFHSQVMIMDCSVSTKENCFAPHRVGV
ncbi:flavin reductase (NADPH)-like [Heterodontus francisci]|uniref:flavin reductase (NADPH)-like n=1 Tax=Heterodontus francisci TaxID=7792 RepID=UPI00355B015A